MCLRWAILVLLLKGQRDLFMGIKDTHQKEGLYLLHNRETYDFRLYSRRRPVEVDDAGTRSLRIN